MLKLVDCNSSKYLPSALSSQTFSPQLQPDNRQGKGNATEQNKFLSFFSNHHMSLLKEKLLEFRGTHNPIIYKEHFHFQERWEKISKTAEESNFNLLMSSNKVCNIISFLVMFLNFILIWFLSVFRLYEIRDAQKFFEIGLILTIADISLKTYLYADHFKTTHQAIKFQPLLFKIEFLANVIGDLWCLIYYVCLLAGTQLSNIFKNQMLPFDLITIIFLTKRAYQIYNYLVILVIATKYKNEMTIFDLVIKMLIILHIFSMLLYAIALTSPESNWMTRINMEDNEWDTKYIYTVYFACTTMFTVGYGDIIPTNKAEIITIMLIQALGMALFGYIVNEVGASLGNMRKKRANLQKDIFNTQRISNYYKLNSDLGKKVRDYVISNQIAQQQLGVSQENDFLLKLNQELRNEVKQTHQLKIIKTSIFFISHWSKKIQIQMAKKLQKCIFAPNQNVSSKGQLGRLYILVKGKVDIYTEKRFGTKVSCRKLLKTIQKLPEQQVFSNVFGFTSFFSGRANRLNAIAKDSTVCYTLGYDDIRDSINQDSNDFQYFHELKQKYQFSKIPEKWQVPGIVNIRQNYSPVVFYVIKKYIKLSQKQKRHKSWSRNQYKNQRVCELNFTTKPFQSLYGQTYQQEESSASQLQSGSMKDGIGRMISDYLFVDNKQYNIDNSDQILQRTPMARRQQVIIQLANKTNNLITNRSYRRKYLQTLRPEKYEEKARQFKEQMIVFTSQFEIGKNYNRFFQRCNKKAILAKLLKRPDLVQQNYMKNLKFSYKSYQSHLKKTIKRNLSDFLCDQKLQQ